jgi:copper resistance protein B
VSAAFAPAVVLAAFVLTWPTASSAQSSASGTREDSTPAQTGGPLPPSIPPVTAEERQAAFPPVTARPVEDGALHSLVLLDRFEWQQQRRDGAPSWEARGWVGGDLNRFWFRTEGDAENGRVTEAEVHAMYGRAVARWWDLVAGIRQDVRPGSPQTWAAIGIQGLAPYWFEVEATGYVGADGRTQFRFETEYELLFTNRVVLQPLVELNLYGKADPDRGIRAGLARTEVGLRLRYVIRREFAPYIGVTWNQKHFGTADVARAAGEMPASARLIVGVRLWR